eukprot:comp26756_c0_seq1/m.47116 comp26756_c0_seq1/g.47116  ORF comp26756_c0_seq1/g.47116 comp26756_c0_seq1/m.47116 type:complete len:309 (-) comp26756_c0_seq1:544-1470(-)
MVAANDDLKQHIPALGQQLIDTNVPLAQRFRALFTLKNIGGVETIDAISKGFGDSSELLKHELAYCLGQMQNDQATEILISILKDTKQEPVVRHEAGEALAALGKAEFIPLMKEHVNDPCVEVAETCTIGLKRLEWLHNPERKEEWIQGPYYSVDPAPPSTDKDIEILRAKLMDTNLNLFERYRALFALRNIGNSESVLAITEGFKDDSALFRHEIAYVLGQIQHPVSVPALSVVLETPTEHPMVRHEAAEALGSIATDPVLPLLQKYAKDEQRIVRESCIVALDMYEYENGGSFQYADGVEKLKSAE